MAGDEGAYPKDGIRAVFGDDGDWRFTHKDGKPNEQLGANSMQGF